MKVIRQSEIKTILDRDGNPAVKLLDAHGNVLWQKHKITKNYLRFDAVTNDVHVGFNDLSLVTEMEYSRGYEEDFALFPEDGVDIRKGGSIWLRAKGLSTRNVARTFVLTGMVEAHGDCRSLIKPTGFEVVALTAYCFYSMFNGCTSLVTAPELPATTLTDSCYRYMFYGCSSLVTAPELPATALAGSCYQGMFNGCTSLVTAPELPATALAGSCYNSMFSICRSLVTAPELPATKLADSCYHYMFNSCRSLVTAPELPATKLTSRCYRYMFNSCRSLVTAPELPATKLADLCYDGMFNSCTKLYKLKCDAMYDASGNVLTDTIDLGWLTNVASNGTFYKNPNWGGPTVRGGNTVPAGWTIEDWIKE